MRNLLLVVLVLAVVGGVAALFTGYLTAGGLGPAEPSIPDRALPDDGPLTPADLAGLTFTQALRGYRMDQVDAAVDRLGAEIEQLRLELAAAREPRPDRDFVPPAGDA